ncbi:MAG: tRNA uridine-5-carboxymethylaminomethyl(34) synthesis GTPase MnmE [Clostridia bacterium]|nr:tRNA uridine-5-carboxymethylaminomethyl(34) synthesis GTPase MnmE [Clostridia bacterium]
MNTIAAISTPAGAGGISIVRISGKDAMNIIKKILKTKNISDFPSHTIKYGHIVGEDGKVIDEVLVSYFEAPKTYTGEDVCEINCHGGNLVTKQILELVLRNGANLAEPGEFTKRAFLNGKMDLSQAEAVMDVINSKSLKEKNASLSQLEGVLGKRISGIKANLVDLLVDVEANIDYPEYDVEEVRREKIEKILDENIVELQKLENSFESGKVLKNGVNTVIVGKPNVGKSSLMNVLLKEERAIVTEIPGTTRDTIEEYLTIRGVPLKIVDTAGIRETTDIVEGIGVEKSKKALKEAELVLVLLDGTRPLEEQDYEILQEVKEKNHLILINKTDEESKIEKEKIHDENVLEISAKTLAGIDELEQKIEEMFQIKEINVNDEIVVTNIRHKDLISKAKEQIKSVQNALKSGVPIDMISIELQNAVQFLGEITGETVSEDVITGIFKKFCLGK